jgi:holo-[acyl-carrier protein] synthase
MEEITAPAIGPTIGIDLVEIARVRQALARHGDRFLGRLFTPDEIAYCLARHDPAPSLAARFAAKEACAKALPVRAAPSWREIEVVIGDGGKPELRLAPRLAARLGGRRAFVSLSHARDLAMAAVIIT